MPSIREGFTTFEELKEPLNMSVKKTFFLFFALLSFLLIASCSTSSYKHSKYKQNKNKRAKRYNDCGCMIYDTNNPDLCYYEEK